MNPWLIIVLCYVLLAAVSFWGLCCFDEPLVLDEKQAAEAEAIAAKQARGQIRRQPRWASISLSLIGIPLTFLLSPLIFLPLLIYWLFDKKRGENIP